MATVLDPGAVSPQQIAAASLGTVFEWYDFYLYGLLATSLVTMGLMGVSTFCVGLLPSYASIGVAAPIALVVLHLLQGLALGGKYVGAAT